MTYRYLFFLSLLLWNGVCRATSTVSVSGRVTSAKGEPLESSTVSHAASGLWALTDAKGDFTLHGLPSGNVELEVRIVGYRTQTVRLNLAADTTGVRIALAEDNLKLSEVSITARQSRTSETTSYVIGRNAQEHTQMLNVADVTSLLPGGKTSGDVSLMSDSRIALRSAGSGEMGNTAFGTAIEVDGVRLSANAQMSSPNGASTRTVAAANVESVEIVTGIPSVEHGDLSNGIVKVRTRRGKTPWTIDASVKPHTRLVAVSKGWNLGDGRRHSGSMLNFSLERAKSFSNLTSPHTSYDRNALSLNYSRRTRGQMPLAINIGLTANVGGYDSEADPDYYADTYSKVRDRVVRGNVRLQWQLNRRYATSVEFSANASAADQRQQERSYTSSASSQAQIHATDEGYNVATEYDADPSAAIILGPIGYWYRTATTDSKPIDAAMHLKYLWAKRLPNGIGHRLKAGIDWHAEGNEGRGTTYDDMRTAPTWRAARYDTLPWLHSLAAYAEEHLTAEFASSAKATLTAGLRADVTHVNGSAYGTANALSPRISGRIRLWDDDGRWLSMLNLHGGWGKSVKLPSMAVLYPTTSYTDQLAFAPGTMADGRTFYAYYTIPSSARYNPSLRWQYATQTEVGVEGRIGHTRISLSAYRTVTHRPYIATSVYTPYTYRYTSQAALESSAIASANRSYSIDPTTGIVTVSDRTGTSADETLAYTERHAFKGNTMWVNGSASTRQGIEWVVDFARIPWLDTEVRWDGNAAFYNGTEHTLMQSRSSLTLADGQPFPYIAYYEGSTTVANGSLTRRVNSNLTVTTHIPVVRLILSVKLEATLCRYSRNLQSDGIIPDGENSYTGSRSNDLSGHYAIVYPRYYATWDDPTTLIPFEEAFLAAKESDTELYQRLMRLVLRSNTDYYFTANRVSPYLSGNINVTKEIGDHVTLSFQATNFWNSTRKVHTSQTDSETTLYGSSYIPSFYYGLSLKIKI